VSAIRTQDEIVARIEAVADEDFMGFRTEVLVTALDYEHARAYLKPEVTYEEWEVDRPSDLDAQARGYYGFALGKIRDHRGISASRSVAKLSEYAWLLGRDDVVAALEAAEYAQYGAPMVKAFAAGFGLDWPDEPELTRMAAGLPCEPGCDWGCGR
jgi:hypothetical protein